MGYVSLLKIHEYFGVSLTNVPQSHNKTLVNKDMMN